MAIRVKNEVKHRSSLGFLSCHLVLFEGSCLDWPLFQLSALRRFYEDKSEHVRWPLGKVARRPWNNPVQPLPIYNSTKPSVRRRLPDSLQQFVVGLWSQGCRICISRSTRTITRYEILDGSIHKRMIKSKKERGGITMTTTTIVFHVDGSGIFLWLFLVSISYLFFLPFIGEFIYRSRDGCGDGRPFQHSSSSSTDRQTVSMESV